MYLGVPAGTSYWREAEVEHRELKKNQSMGVGIWKMRRDSLCMRTDFFDDRTNDFSSSRFHISTILLQWSEGNRFFLRKTAKLLRCFCWIGFPSFNISRTGSWISGRHEVNFLMSALRCTPKLSSMKNWEKINAISWVFCANVLWDREIIGLNLTWALICVRAEWKRTS